MEEYSNTIIRVCGIEPESIVDGPGFRYVLFVQGCPHRCEGCHNPESHDFNAGFDMTVGDVYLEFLQNHFLNGITLSGGEPFCQPEALLELVKLIKEDRNKDVMAYSGYTYEELLAMHNPAVDGLLEELSILVDGKFELAQRNLTLRYRGSENQRVIDMKKTRETGEIVIYKSSFDDL